VEHNELRDWAAEKGIEIDSHSEEFIAELCAYNIFDK